MMESGGGAHDPFAAHFQTTNGGGALALERMERMADMFGELKDYAPFEWMPFARLQKEYLVSSLSTVVGASVNGFLSELEQYEKSGPLFTTIIVDGASSITDAALASILSYNRKRTTRLIMTGDVKSTSVIPSSFSRFTSSALYTGAKLNLSMYERLASSSSSSSASSGAVGVHDLVLHQRSRTQISALYQWRYGSSMSSSLGSNYASKKGANAGMMYTTQFVDVQKSEELACPLGEYQNVMEAEYIVHVYQYLRLLGHAPHKITILTTYDEQVHLIRDIMNLRCVDSTHFGKPKDITTIDQYNGLENDIVLLSTVRTTAMPFDTMPDLVNAFSRARLGLYIFGHRALFNESYEMTPIMSKYCQTSMNLCLVGGESHPTRRRVQDAPPAGNVCEVTGGLLHMASIVRMMVGAPLLPGSVVRR